MSDIDDIIETGMVFRSASKPKTDDGKVKTKAKKKKYITGAHGSGSSSRRLNTVSNVLTDTSKQNNERPHFSVLIKGNWRNEGVCY